MPVSPVFVECDSSKYVDGDPFDKFVFYDGNFTYENVQGAKKTVGAFTTDRDKFLKKAGLEVEADAEKPIAQIDNQKAEAEPIMASAKPGIFIVERYAEGEGIFVHGCSNEGLLEISKKRATDKEQASAKWNVVTTGQGKGSGDWVDYDTDYLLLGLPAKETYVRNSTVGGMFIEAGTAKLDEDTRIQAFRFVGLGKSDAVENSSLIDR